MAELGLPLPGGRAVVREALKALINALTGITVVGEAGNGLSVCPRVPGLRMVSEQSV